MQTAMFARRRRIPVVAAGMRPVIPAAPATRIARQPLSVIVADGMNQALARHALSVQELSPEAAPESAKGRVRACPASPSPPLRRRLLRGGCSRFRLSTVAVRLDLSAFSCQLSALHPTRPSPRRVFDIRRGLLRSGFRLNPLSATMPPLIAYGAVRHARGPRY